MGRVRQHTLAIVACASLTLVTHASQSPTAAEVRGARWTSSRTADGQPDLEGVWRNNTATPLERPKRLGGRKFLTTAEVQGLHDLAQTLSRISDDHSSWLGDLDFDNRTSLIIDPTSGRLPPLTRQAQTRAHVEAARTRDRAPADSYQDLPLSERCISFGVPDLLAGYNSYVQIAQGPGYVALSAERIHDVRVIPLDGRPHLAPTVRLWRGDSRGRWDGNTLVVDTTNFSSKSAFRESAENRHIIERFRRTGPDRLEYEVTIGDPTTWTRPWTLMIPLRRTTDRIYEYACHEGNQALRSALSGARAEEHGAGVSASDTVK